MSFVGMVGHGCCKKRAGIVKSECRWGLVVSGWCRG